MTDQEFEWRFIRAKLIGHGMYLKEELQKQLLPRNSLTAARLVNSLNFRVNMDESIASGELVIEFLPLWPVSGDRCRRKFQKRKQISLEQFVGSEGPEEKVPGTTRLFMEHSITSSMICQRFHR